MQAGPVDKSLLRRPVPLPKVRFLVPAIWRIALLLAEPAYLTVISIFILLPLVVLFPVSFSSAEVLIFPPPGYSLQWFQKVLDDPAWIAAALTSLRIGAATCVLTLALAISTVLGFGRNSRFQGTAEAAVLSFGRAHA